MHRRALILLCCLCALNLGARRRASLPPPADAAPVFDLGVSTAWLTAPVGDPRLFVLDLAGVVEIVKDGVVEATPFLDISAQVTTTGQGGLLGLAFAPDYASSGEFYVYYTANASLESRLSRFTVSANPDVADSTSEQVLLTIDKTMAQHHGGTILFRPSDGYLYLAHGDGHESAKARDGQSFLGKMLRLDVSGSGAYSVPPDNPFVGNPSFLPEIWALGLRNPFRFGFDPVTGDLWLADVGEIDREEVNYEAAADPGGHDYGWPIAEGSLCNVPPCAGVTFPVHDYDHSNGRCSVTGGTVYRGEAIPDYRGLYFFADFCSGEFWSIDPPGFQVTNRTGPLNTDHPPFGGPVSISPGGYGELFIVHFASDTYRMDATRRDDDGDGIPNQADNCKQHPNGPLLRDAGDHSQRDSNGDGFGNVCDPDLDDDGDVDSDDETILQGLLGSGDPDADLNGDGAVDAIDLVILQNFGSSTPGPAGPL